MTDTQLKIFVIVVTYKGMRWYDRCFTSLRNSTIPIQTIVVDNASNDGTVEYIKENYPEIMLIESKENLGFGKGNNLALKYAYEHDCDYVFLLNQDAWIDADDTLEKLVDVAQRHPEYGILSPMHLRADRKSLYIQIEDGKTDHGNQLLGDCYFQSLKEVYTFRFVNAAAWLLPKNTIETVGGFDPIFLQYGEDDDYINRLRFHGLLLGLCPNVRIIHDHQHISNPLSAGRIRFYQTLIGEFIDPNMPNLVRKYIRYLWRKTLICVMKGKFKDAKIHIKDASYLKEKVKAIEKSRSVNCLKQPSWLQ